MPKCADCGKRFRGKQWGTPNLCRECDDPDKDFQFHGDGTFDMRIRIDGVVVGGIGGDIPRDRENIEFLGEITRMTLEAAAQAAVAAGKIEDAAEVLGVSPREMKELAKR